MTPPTREKPPTMKGWREDSKLRGDAPVCPICGEWSPLTDWLEGHMIVKHDVRKP